MFGKYCVFSFFVWIIILLEIVISIFVELFMFFGQTWNKKHFSIFKHIIFYDIPWCNQKMGNLNEFTTMMKYWEIRSRGNGPTCRQQPRTTACTYCRNFLTTGTHNNALHNLTKSYVLKLCTKITHESL